MKLNLLNSLESGQTFLEYGSIKLKPYTYLKKLGILNIQTKRGIGPVNTFINRIINMVARGLVSCTKLVSCKDSILNNIMNKRKKIGQMFIYDEVENALIINHQSSVNMYMRFIQFDFSITGLPQNMNSARGKSHKQKVGPIVINKKYRKTLSHGLEEFALQIID